MHKYHVCTSYIKNVLIYFVWPLWRIVNAERASVIISQFLPYSLHNQSLLFHDQHTAFINFNSLFVLSFFIFFFLIIIKSQINETTKLNFDRTFRRDG